MRGITRRFGAWVGDPWRPPVVLAMVTWVYVLWSIVLYDTCRPSSPTAPPALKSTRL